MYTLSLNRILFHSLVSLSGVVLSLIAVTMLLLWLGNTSHSAQASSERWETLGEQPSQDGSIAPASLSTSSTLTLTGEAVNNGFGGSVATAGDVNGDGYSDVIVGAEGYYSATGRVYIYLGTANGLSPTPVFTTTGEAISDHFGISVGTAGDVNGDGYADILVGAYGYNNSTGRAYVYLGSANGLSATPAFTVTGEAPGTDFGYSVGTAGDVNGDGYADVIVGALGYINSPGQAFTGRVYVYLGSASGLNSTPAITLTGETTGDFFGGAVGTAGDVNGDGYADVIIGAPSNSNFKGRVYVYPGTANGMSATLSFTATGQFDHDNLGGWVSTAGDVNGDGYADIIVGAIGYASVYLGSVSGLSITPTFTTSSPGFGGFFGSIVGTAGDVNGDGYADIIFGGAGYNNNAGQVLMFTGTASGVSTTPAFTATGEAANNYFGVSVGTAGDVNGDGYSDIIVGAPYYNSNTGRAYVYLGAADPPGSTPAFTVTGEKPGDYSGNWAGTAGDVNGDGYADIVVGAPSYSSTGRAHVYLGSASGLSASPAFTATSQAGGDTFGFSVGTAGDVNGDGYSDIVIGAHGYNGNTGRAYVYLGSASELSASPAFTATGAGPNNYFGLSVSTAGDVNGDGYADIIIGARGYSNKTGQAFIYLGSESGLSTTPAFTATGEAPDNYFGFAVATAGDVNSDGYSDVIVSAPGYYTVTGRAYIYLGSASSLSTTPALTITGEHFYSQFGFSVGTTGDVNGDGYSEVIVGAIFYTGMGRAYVYSGSVSGLSTMPSFTATGELHNENLGASVATSGDVNGDGYADVIIGAPGYISGTGRALVYLGSASGLSATPAFSLTGVTNSGFGYPVGTVGDVNGDGYADIIVGTFTYINNPGSVYVYPGNSGYGLSLAPQQRRADDSSPIAHGGKSDSATSFRLAALGRSPFGRGKVKLEWEVKPLGTPLDGTGTQQSAAWLDSGAAGATFNELVSGLSANTLYHWRVRVRYHPASTPFQQYSRWFTQPWNGWQEADLRTAAGTAPPPIKLYLPFIAR